MRRQNIETFRDMKVINRIRKNMIQCRYYVFFNRKFLVREVKRWETLTSGRDYDNMNVRVRAIFNIKIIRNKLLLFHLLAIEFILYVLCSINTFKLVFTDINLPKDQIIRIINITKFTFFFLRQDILLEV